MTSRSPGIDTTRDVPEPDPRLRVKPANAVPGHVGGAWWPRSTDPAAEFPGLVMALSSWVGPVMRVEYHPDAWGPAVTRLVTNGWPVWLDGVRTIEPVTVVAIGLDESRTVMLVIPPHTPGDIARAVLQSTVSRDAARTAAEILTSNGVRLDGQSR